MSEFGDEGGESPSEGWDNKSDEVPDETSDAPDEKPDEEQFNPNDDVPDEGPDEGLFNPNDDVPDETPDEKLFNPNDDVPDESPDEGLFNPNDDVPDECPDEELFNPNDDVPDESPDEGLFNPNDDVADDNPDEELDDPIKEYESESEPEKQPEGINNPSNSGNVSVIEPVQKPEYESEEKPEEFEVVTPNGELERPGESPEVMEIRADLEEWGYEPEYDSEMESKSEYEQEPEQTPEQELETDPGQEQEEQVAQEEFKRDKQGNIVLDAKQMKLFGSRVSSQEEMEVEILEEELEELFDSYEEQGIEHDRGLESSIELEQESSQEQLETEQEAQGFNRQHQEEKVNQEMERAQEQELSQELSEKSQAEISHISKIIDPKSMEIIREKDEKENAQESSRNKIQENEQELVWEKEQSQEQSQEIEQESIREIHQNIEVIQEEIQEQIEEQKEPTLRESDELFEEQYKQETGRRPIYAGKETRGFIEWKEHLNEKEEKQEEKNKLLQEKEKEIKKQSKEIRESKEEWAQYLANSIKGAEFPENIKVELNELLEKYEDLRKLLEKLKNREIAEEEFEKEVKEFEHILIEKRHIARPLFMNFDWFRRYYNGMIRKAGKRVAHLYISKKTREFLSYISGRIKQLQNIGNSQENAEKFKEFLEKSFQIKEKWALLLNRLIRETPNKEISTEVKEELGVVINTFCKIRTILFNKNILEEDKEKLLQECIEKCNPRFFELFEILKRFLGAYDNCSRKWMEQSLIFEGKKTVRRLSQKLENIKKENAIHQILNETSSSFQNFKEILKQNLYKTTELNMNEKSKIIKIIQNEKFAKENKVKLTNILSKLSIEELISLLGEDFKQYSQSYVKNRYYFNKFKKIIIFDFLDKKIIEQEKEDSDIVKYIKSEEKDSFLSNNEQTYIVPRKWFLIKNSVLRQIREILRDRNITVKEINIITGIDFSKISKGRAMKEESFFKLNNLVGKDTLLKLFNQDFIPHNVNIGNDKYVALAKNEISAEFMAIMLGDGHLDKDGSSSSIALNIIDDPDYVKYVKNEIIDKLFKNNSFFVEDFNCKQSPKRFVLVSKKKSVHYAIYELGKSVRKTGLIPGNKVKNQVSVPDWIYYDRNENKILIVSSLRGLFDTDGSISVNMKRNTLNLAFSNSSLPLCEDFIHMCSILGIRTGDVIKCHKESGNTEYKVFISSKSQIQEFLNKIEPRKIKEQGRRIFLGCKLILFSLNRDIKESVEHKIKVWKRKNNIKKFEYTKKNAELLKFWCETEFLRNKIKSIFEYSFRGKITDEMIDKAISKALEYQYTIYNIELAKFYVDLYKKLGNLSRIREYLRDIGTYVIPDKETIKNYINQYLEEEKAIDSINFLKRYKITNITLYEGINRIKSFPKKLRNVICGVLYDKLLNFSTNVKNSLIIEYLKAYFINNEILLLNWLLDDNKNLNFSQALTSYFIDLIFLIKEILKQHAINRHVNIQSLSRIKEMPFKYSVIREILNYLISAKNLK